MAVIRDVANLAGVAVGTVSKYLKDPSSIKEINRKKIEHAIKELDYHPSPLARSMRTKKSNTIAIVTPSVNNPFYVQVFDTIRKEALEHGYTCILYTADDDLDKLKFYLSKLSIQPVDGIVLCLMDNQKTLQSFIYQINPNIPMIIVGWEYEQNPSVVIDVYHGIHLSTNHVISSGRKKIAYLSGVLDSGLYQMKFKAYSDALTKNNISVDKNMVFECSNRFDSAVKAAKKLIDQFPDIDSVVCATDVMAVSMLRVLNDRHISVNQISVIGFDNIPLAEVSSPPLSTIAQPIDEIGKNAYSMLNSLIEKTDEPVESVKLDMKLIVRESTLNK